MGFDEWFKIVTALFAAGWAVLVYVLIRLPLARAGLLKSQMEQDEYQRKKSLKAGLSLGIQATVHRNPGGRGYVIVAVVTITNRDDSEIKRIEWKGAEAPFHGRLAEFKSNGEPEYVRDRALFVRKTSQPNDKAEGHRIRPGATESLSFAIVVSDPGVYLLSFRIPVDQEDQKAAKARHMDLPATWTCNTHVVVGDTPLSMAPPAPRAEPV